MLGACKFVDASASEEGRKEERKMANRKYYYLWEIN